MINYSIIEQTSNSRNDETLHLIPPNEKPLMLMTVYKNKETAFAVSEKNSNNTEIQMPTCTYC